MRKLSVKERAWVKGFHICSIAVWLGSAICMTLLLFFNENSTNGDELYAINACNKLLDDFILTPAATIALITGFMLSGMTNWGFFKHQWLEVKIIASIIITAFGTFCLKAWTDSIAAISNVERLGVFQNPEYLRTKKLLIYTSPIQALAMAGIIFISISKPWNKAPNKLK